MLFNVQFSVVLESLLLLLSELPFHSRSLEIPIFVSQLGVRDITGSGEIMHFRTTYSSINDLTGGVKVLPER